jgi:spermidine synthase
MERAMTRFIYLCFFLSGFSGLVNEVVWSRLFVYTMGCSHLSIAVVVSIFMGGLALGSSLGGRLADRVASPLVLYGWLTLGAGLLSGAVVPLLHLWEPLLGVAYRLNDGKPNHPVFTVVKVLVSIATILLPTTCMGATLPALARHLTRSSREIGARLGGLYAVNTFAPWRDRRRRLLPDRPAGPGLDRPHRRRSTLVGAAVVWHAGGLGRPAAGAGAGPARRTLVPF